MGDVDLVWSNCRSFNEPESEICDLADQAQQALRMRWQQQGLPTVTPIPPSASKQKKKACKKAQLDAGGITANVNHAEFHVTLQSGRYWPESCSVENHAVESRLVHTSFLINSIVVV